MSGMLPALRGCVPPVGGLDGVARNDAAVRERLQALVEQAADLTRRLQEAVQGSSGGPDQQGLDRRKLQNETAAFKELLKRVDSATGAGVDVLESSDSKSPKKTRWGSADSLKDVDSETVRGWRAAAEKKGAVEQELAALQAQMRVRELNKIDGHPWPWPRERKS